MGTWSREGGENAVRPPRRDPPVAAAVLVSGRQHDAALPFQPATGPEGTAGGLIRGQPTAKAPVAGDNVLQIDRLVRALGSREWSVSVLASPEPETTPDGPASALVAEMAFAEDAEKATRHDLPIVKQFTDIVEPTLQALLEATTTGAWRTAVYLEADAATYSLLASVWRSVFSGERSTPETISVMDLGAAAGRRSPPPGPSRSLTPSRGQPSTGTRSSTRRCSTPPSSPPTSTSPAWRSRGSGWTSSRASTSA